MATFRYKPDKVKYLNVVKTLDETHQKFANDFQKKRLNLPDKIKELNKMKNNLNIENNSDILITDSLIKNKAILRDNIKALETDINNIKNGREEIEYYSQTCDILMDYYNLFDNNDDDEEDNNNTNNNTNTNTNTNTNKFITLHNPKNDENVNNNIISETTFEENESEIATNEKLSKFNKLSQSKRKEKKPTRNRTRNTAEVNPSKNILTFFSKPDQQKNNLKKPIILSEQLPEQLPEQMPEPIKHIIANRASLFDLYMSIIDKKYMAEKPKTNNIKMCENCLIEKILNQPEGKFVCTKCGEFEHIIIDSEITNHKDSGNEKPRTPYKKMTHLSEILNQFQAKESTELPKDICDKIIFELKKLKITILELAKMKYSKAKILIKQILKKLRLTPYYEHIPFILSSITKKPPPTISRETEDLLKKLFKLIEAAFVKHCPDDRKNFFNYSFLFRKLFEILDMPEFADCFTLLKSRDKLKIQDKIWEKICEELDWPFYPSI